MAKWIEFASIRRTAPLLAVLAHYRIRELLGSGKDHLRGRCPLYGGEGRDIFHADTASRFFTVSRAPRAGPCWTWWRRSSTVACGKQRRESVPPLGFRLRVVDPRHPYPGTRGISETTAAEFGVGYYAGPD